MANRYWVGGSGTWDTTSTTNWSSTSNGAAGASAPGSADVAIFDANSGSTYTVTLGENVTVLTVTANAAVGLTIAFGTNKITIVGNNALVWRSAAVAYTGTPVVDFTYSGATGTRQITPGGAAANALSINITAGTDIVSLNSGSTGIFGNIDFTGFSGTFTRTTTSSGITIYGNLTLSTGMTLASQTGAFTFAGTSGPYTITSNGKTMDFPLTFNGVGGTWKLGDTLTVGSTRALTLTNGTLDGNGTSPTIGTFALGSGTKTLTLGNGTWTVAGTSWNANTNVTNLTVTTSTGTISMTSGSAKTFSGGAKTWPILNQGGAGALTIAQSNTFTDITNTTKGATLTLTINTTQTVSAFSFSGTSVSQTSLNSSTAGTLATLNGTGGIVNARYLNIKDVRAQGYTEWNALVDQGAVDQGNTPGWNFITLGIKKILRKVFSRQIIRPVIEEIQ